MRRHTLQDATGVIAVDGEGNAVFVVGTTAPTDGIPGFAVGCQFLKLDGAAGTNTYINEGTSTACDFNLLSATVAELNQAVGDGDEVVITTNVITAAENGKTFYLSLAGGFTSTLPAPALGLRFRFIVKTAPTTAYVITTNAGANILYGHLVERAGGVGVAGAAQDTLNFVANQAIIGDWVEFYSDGTNWYLHGMVNVIAGATFAVT